MVGPNGSGKSNVIDAMLFVFGKRAKQLRLNKVSELIHNSTHHRNLGEARVSVHFQEIVDIVSEALPLHLPLLQSSAPARQLQAPLSALASGHPRLCLRRLPLPLPQDDDSFEVVPASDFVISRTALRNNTSNYYINDRKSNFTEVTELLKGKGVDLDNNRFLILQVGVLGGWLTGCLLGWAGGGRLDVHAGSMYAAAWRSTGRRQQQQQRRTLLSPFLLPMCRVRLSRFR